MQHVSLWQGGPVHTTPVKFEVFAVHTTPVKFEVFAVHATSEKFENVKTSSFSKTSVFQMLSVRTKMQGRCFKNFSGLTFTGP